ncbi:hypothetical protein LTS15_002300 [Exophiala xenobiotica]|nr:hypothetical protein LTS15_002300 [Exophiala xenobiotica]
MAQAGQSLLYVCRSCRQSLRSALKTSRSFSTTPNRQKVVPSFTPTAHGELDQLLVEWREKVFVPAALPEHHRKLIYKPSRQQALLNDGGVQVTMSDDEEITLQPRDYYDKPNVRESMRKMIRILSEQNEDVVWNNLGPWLEGLQMSKQRLPDFFWEKITRKACEIGKERIILACAEKSSKTGFSLKKRGVTFELMLGFHKRAADHGFAGPELESAWQRALKVTRLLEDMLHDGDKLKRNEVDPRKDPLVLSVLTELAAAKALESGGNADQVASYAARMLPVAQERDFSLQMAEGLKEDVRTRVVQNAVLESFLPMQNAINLALKFDAIKKSDLGEKLSLHLGIVNQKIDNAVQKLRAVSDGKKRRGELMYDQFYEKKDSGS